jgi:hypothetical protein
MLHYNNCTIKKKKKKKKRKKMKMKNERYGAKALNPSTAGISKNMGLIMYNASLLTRLLGCATTQVLAECSNEHNATPTFPAT